MNVTRFDSTKLNLRDVLNDVGEGKIQLPDFQRGWVWDDDHIRDLITSVSLSFPIGAIIDSEDRWAGRQLQATSYRGDEKTNSASRARHSCPRWSAAIDLIIPIIEIRKCCGYKGYKRKGNQSLVLP